MNDYSGMYTALSEFSALVKSNEVQKSSLELAHTISANIKSTKEYADVMREVSLIYSNQAKALAEQLRNIMAENINYSEYARKVLESALEYYKNHPVEKPDFNIPSSQKESSTKDDSVRTMDLQMFAESADDYIIVDEESLNILEIPDNVFIPIGKKRVKIKTELLISILLSIFFSLAGLVLTAYQEQQAQIAEEQYRKEQLQLQEEENQMYRDFFNSIDASNSANKETIIDLIQSIEALTEVLQSQEPISQESDLVPDQAQEIENNNLE